MQDKEVPIIQADLKNRLRRVTAADHFVIPPQSESMIDVYVERDESDDFSSKNTCLIEATEQFQASYPLKMAATLVDVNKGCTFKVRLLNPFPTAVSINQDTTVGKAEPIDGTPHVLFRQEDEKEESNFHKVRSKNQDIPKKINEGQVKSLPEHLKDLFHRSTKDLTDAEKESVADLLLRYQDTFSCNEWDLGVTHLTEHAIKTEGKLSGEIATQACSTGSR